MNADIRTLGSKTAATAFTVYMNQPAAPLCERVLQFLDARGDNFVETLNADRSGRLAELLAGGSS
jgi:hypothetical protein